MVERKLRKMSFSLARDVEERSSETRCTEAEANTASQENELDKSIVEIYEEIKDLFNSNDNVFHSRLHHGDMSVLWLFETG